MKEILGNLALWPAEKISNALLRADPHAMAKIGKFSGSALQLNISQPAVKIRIAIERFGIRLTAVDSEQFDLPVDATISGRASDLLKLLLQDSSQQALVSDRVALQGNTQLVQDLFTTLRSLDMDWQGFLAPIIGDIATNEIGAAANTASDWAQDSRARMHSTVDDYLKEEIKLFPHRNQIKAFEDSLDQLRLRIDRTQAHMESLNSVLLAKSGQAAVWPG